jgi:hypothetical protein
MKILLAIFLIGLGGFTALGQCVPSEVQNAFSRLTQRQKVAVWDAKLRRTLRGTDDPQKRAVIFEVAGALRDDSFTDTPQTIDGAGLLARIKENFTRAEIRRIFYSLEQVEAEGNAIVPVAYTAQPFRRQVCTCNTDFNILCDKCVNNVCTEPTIWGCGPMWLLPCNNHCKNNNNYEGEDPPNG